MTPPPDVFLPGRGFDAAATAGLGHLAGGLGRMTAAAGDSPDAPASTDDHTTAERSEPPGAAAAGSADSTRVVVVGADGQPIAMAEDSGESSVADLIEQPAKVMRVGSMIKQLLEEVRSAPLDEASRARLRDIHRRSITELESGLAPELIEELDRLSLPFSADNLPTDSELRIAQAQLVGWLEGLFHGIQTALFAQQMAARAQLEQMRRAAITAEPSGAPPGAVPDGHRRATSSPYL